ncbi:unnamed protein product [Vicia faba]|uniref:Uncharacterized protein n=1 Tax=Vicia faba TaxID=3906 RepID=A0AAV1AG56_VICFA|nr:unnamed protein product [Vicia faba]
MINQSTYVRLSVLVGREKLSAICLMQNFVHLKSLDKDLAKKWKQIILNNSFITPLEHCEWLNKLLTEIWPNNFNPKLSSRLKSIVEVKLHRLCSILFDILSRNQDFLKDWASRLPSSKFDSYFDWAFGPPSISIQGNHFKVQHTFQPPARP